MLELCTEEIAELPLEEGQRDGVVRWRKERAFLCIQCRLTHWSCTDQTELSWRMEEGCGRVGLSLKTKEESGGE